VLNLVSRRTNSVSMHIIHGAMLWRALNGMDDNPWQTDNLPDRRIVDIILACNCNC